ncbi:WD40/YVTN/BNR-like repeat-containing protein [Chloroflexota bacterium]
MKRLICVFFTAIICCLLLASCGNPDAPSPEMNEADSPEQEFILVADRYEIAQGECTFLRWEVIGGYGVLFYDEALPSAGELEICPFETQEYVLRADMGDLMLDRAVEIRVTAPGDADDASGGADDPGSAIPVRSEIVPGRPAYQAGSWQITSGPPGGLGYDIRMDPRNLDVMYVTDALAGAFKSLDGGENWFPINNGITTRTGRSGDHIPVFSLTVDPNNPDTLWVGTQFGGAVFRSDDGGQNWRPMSNGIIERGLTIRGFTVQQGNSDVVYLAGEISSWEWNNNIPLPGIGLDMTKGAVYKTTNGGQNWSRIWLGDNLARYIWINPNDPDLLYVSTGIIDREAANSDPVAHDPGGVGILRSRDGGSTWEVLGENNGFWVNELQVGSLFMHPTNPDILIGAVANDSYLWKLGSPLGAIYLTENGGDSWERVLELDNASTVEICISDPNVVYAGSINGIHRSDDGGHSWQETAGHLWGTKDVLAGFPIDMLCDPRDPMRIFINNYIGGNFLSDDGGFTWEMASKGYTGAIVKQVDVSYSDPGLVYSASRMGVFISQDGGDNWVGTAYAPARAPEATVVSVDKFDSNHILAVMTDAGPDPWTSWDAGKSWAHAPTGLFVPGGITGAVIDIIFSTDDYRLALAAVGSRGCYDRFDRCETDPGYGIIRSTDRGATWSKTDLTDAHIVDIKFVNETLVYAAAYPDIIYRSQDGGQTWEIASQGILSEIAFDPGTPAEIIKQYSILSVAVDPFDHQRILVGFRDGGVKLSTDGGNTWEAVSAGLLPELSADVLVADPVHEGVFYLGSENFGIFYSTDSGTSWTMLNNGLTNRFVTDLALSGDGSVLYMATDGGGVFQLGYMGE